MRSERYQSVAQKPEEDGESVESEEDPYISALQLSNRKQRQLIIVQWALLAVLLVAAIAAIFWKSQIIQDRYPYLSIDRPLPGHIYCSCYFSFLSAS